MSDRTVNPEIKEFMLVVRRALLMIVAYIDNRYRVVDESVTIRSSK